MSKIRLVYWCSLIIIGVFFYSCKVQEKENVKIKIKPRSTKYLVNKLIENEFKFDGVSAKASVTFDDGKKTSFKVHLRIKQDSAIWISITPLLGIEFARVLITQDSVKLINRSSSEYFVGDFDYINKLFNSDLDYQMIEALLIGNSLDFEMNDKVFSAVDRQKDLYFLSTEKKRKVKKEIRKDKDKIKNQVQALWLDPVNFKINNLLLSSPHNARSLSGAYSNYKAIDTQLIPYELRFKLESASTVLIDVNYTKFSLDNSLSFPFNIPSKYEQIKQ